MDKGLLDRFETSWQGFDAGVDVLGARLRAGKLQRLLHWHGRPSKEDTWFVWVGEVIYAYCGLL
ncbi:hypothetical protein H634G_11522 [Metarhizium anisopliae BRIP 53293]|uniref:Uncharacterized protein n=1 Tax=Metarhizium anisopliae BRIP 53293 TaxID=1291518 RepID=A0A0D9NH67_METAN|nr:hypothetical protein H634G_11522 [Metarhizium anisopliae BRIP 53293]KJK84703.1 hypothetical protein H633G_11559 [Metarhizium anisopliae BRIP 53284]